MGVDELVIIFSQCAPTSEQKLKIDTLARSARGRRWWRCDCYFESLFTKND